MRGPYHTGAPGTSSGGGGVWGTITGVLSAQTDLQAALDAKVAGPGSATDNAVARFDLATGELIQNSGLILDDSNVLIWGGDTNLYRSAANVLKTDDSFIIAGTGSSPDPVATGTEHFGAGSSATGQNSTAFGSNATATTTNSVVIGRSSTDGGNSGAVALGFGAGSTGANSFALGRGSTAAAQSIAIGFNAAASFITSMAFGRAATTTAANQFVAGADTYYIDNIFFGNGVVSATPQAFTLNGTGGSGSNIAGGNAIIAGGKGTGTGLGGSVKIQTAQAGSSGSSLNSLLDRWVWDSYGQMKSDQTVTIPAIGSGFVVWDRKDMYFTGTQTVGTGGNIGGTTILYADHIVKYATSQGLAGVSIFDGRPIIRPTTGVTDNASNVSWRTFFSNISFSPELSTAVTATTGAFGSFYSAPAIGVAAGSHASAAAVVPSFYSYLSNLTVGAQSTATIGRHFWLTNANVAGTLTTQVGLDIEALTSGGSNYGIRVAKASTAAIQLSSTDGTAPGGLLFGTDTTLHRSAANILALNGDLTVTDEAYGAGWDGSLEVPTKNAVYDKIQTISGGSAAGSDTWVQFNDATAFGAEAAFYYNKTTNLLGVDNILLSDGAAATPSLQFATDPTSGMYYSSGGNAVGIVVAGSDVVAFTTANVTLQAGVGLVLEDTSINRLAAGELYVGGNMLFGGGNGIKLTSPDTTEWLVTANDSGELETNGTVKTRPVNEHRFLVMNAI
jgi:hypothetical protein